MYSIKVACLVFCVEFLITVSGDVKSQPESLNATAAEDRKDVQLKKPPRKRGTFGFNYANSFGPGLSLPNHFKSYGHYKKEWTPQFIEKYVAIPVHVKVPVDRPVPVHVPKPYPVTVEKAVPFPVKINVPQPYPVYKKVAVPVKVPVDRPVPVQVFKPYPVYVEKQIPYPVDKPVPVPVRVPVDRPYPVYVSVEKPTTTTTEKPMAMAMMQMPMQMQMPMAMKWQPEKTYSLPTGKSFAWPEKTDSFTFKLNSEETENDKLVSSLLEISEPTESEISWPENLEFEIRK